MTRQRWSRAALLLLAAAVTGCGSTVGSSSPGYATSDQARDQSSLLVPGATTPTQQGAQGQGPATTAPGTGIPNAPRTGSGQAEDATLPPATTAGGLTATGPGWDAKHVYVGISTADDAQQAVARLGYRLPVGDARTITKAIVADINARGGVLGRQLVPVFRDHSSASIQANAQVEAQSDCAYFSSDRRVVAYLDSSLGETSGIAACMHRVHVPFFDLNSAVYDENDFAQYGPDLWPVRAPSVTRLIPVWSARLQAQGFFKGWDSLNGAAGSKPTKVGLYLEDNPLGHRIAGQVTRALPSALRGVVTYYYAPTIGQNDASNAVLQFRSAGVTHLLTLPSAAGAWALFTLAAENQHYRPRYGLTSYDWMQFAVENVPAAQLSGSMGVGWLPVWDVDSAHQPKGLPGMPRCRVAMAKGGQGGQEGNAAPACDALYLLTDAAKASGGFSASALRAGILRIGPTFGTAGTFRSALSASNPGLPGAVRDVRYDGSCSCYLYGGGDRPL